MANHPAAPSGVRILLPHPNHRGKWIGYTDPAEVIQARAPDEVLSVLANAEAWQAAGHRVVGFIAYEAGPGFESALPSRDPGPVPLAWFARCENPAHDVAFPPQGQHADGQSATWTPTLDLAAYRRAIAAVREAIARGETYQVNFTFGLTSKNEIDPAALFARLYEAQPTPYAMFIETPAFAVVSVSPELFFETANGIVTCRPMKGTAARSGRDEQDRELAHELAGSEKNRAENLMIVDMIRNDLGRIAESGSVKVDQLFAVEAWPTVWQMTSRVQARTTVGMTGIVSALFPCASITGAPKIRTASIIHHLEPRPRGLYTGAVGVLEPDGSSRFSVAIRTVWIDRTSGLSTYGVGSGIVWDSNPEAEYQECLDKAAILTTPRFDLLETMAWSPDTGFRFLAEHLERLADSARHFGFPLDDDAIRSALANAVAGGTTTLRVRMTASRLGEVRCAVKPVAPFHEQPDDHAPVRTGCIAAMPVDSSHRFLFHKTTARDVYDQAQQACPDVDDVLLVNERGEVTEFAIGNVVIQTGGTWLTPPVASGLLNGAMRRHLLNAGTLREAVLTPRNLAEADSVWMINSVRGWSRVVGLTSQSR